MLVWFRASLAAALLVIAATTPVFAAEKPFQDPALDDAAITLEDELKEEAGAVEKPVAKLKEEAEALLLAQDLQAAAKVFTQIVTVAPDDTSAWRALSNVWLKIPKTDDDDGSQRYDQARTAAKNA